MSDLAATVRSILGRELTRVEAARQVTDALHAGGFRWVGVYEVTPTDVVNLAWSGPAGPAHPTFPIDQGLTAEAVATRVQRRVQRRRGRLPPLYDLPVRRPDG